MPSMIYPSSNHHGNILTVKVEKITAEDCSSVLHRPNSLSLRSTSSSSSATPGASVSNKTSLNTIGQGMFDLDLDNMLDGHTGLTPLTGILSSMSSTNACIHSLPFNGYKQRYFHLTHNSSQPITCCVATTVASQES